MTHLKCDLADLSAAVQILRDQDRPFAFVTIVRTVGATSVKPGAKALVGADGSIIQGWLGGGCTQGAIKSATLDVMKSGVPQLISVQPAKLLTGQGTDTPSRYEGIICAESGCPSGGTIDIFIEPCLLVPELVIIGESPVATALSQIARQFQYKVMCCTVFEVTMKPRERDRYIVIATQGKGDLVALKAALGSDAEYRGFVGSRMKFGTLAKTLVQEGFTSDEAATIKVPAGLDIGAVAPEEIALSILAELISVRRCKTA